MPTNPPAANGGDAIQKAEHKVNKASAQAHEGIDRASNAARPAVDKMAGRAHSAVDRASGAASNAADKIEEKSAQWIEAEQEMMSEVKAYVRENPLQAVGMAIAGGFLLSRIIGSR